MIDYSYSFLVLLIVRIQDILRSLKDQLLSAFSLCFYAHVKPTYFFKELWTTFTWFHYQKS